jgi:hypothetical protein
MQISTRTYSNYLHAYPQRRLSVMEVQQTMFQPEKLSRGISDTTTNYLIIPPHLGS